MAEFAIFVSKQAGAFSKAAMLQFKQQNMGRFTGDNAPLGEIVDRLDEKVKLQLAQLNAAYLPIPNANSGRWTAMGGSQPLDKALPKVKSFVGLLQGLERLIETGATGAFEIPPERAPEQNMRFTFATGKFVKDHVCNFTKTKIPEITAEAETVARRRMLREVPIPGPVQPGGDPPTVLEFTNIPASSTLNLSAQKIRNALKEEIDSRQKEFEAIYKYLVSEGKRVETLLQGDHEEVMYTTKTQIDFYECSKPAQPTDEFEVVKYPQNHLRYAVQKVGQNWLLHHMGGRAAPGQVGVAPNNFQAFNYANVQGIQAVAGTFTRIG